MGSTTPSVGVEANHPLRGPPESRASPRELLGLWGGRARRLVTRVLRQGGPLGINQVVVEEGDLTVES